MNKDSVYIAKLEAENALLKQEVSDLKHQLHTLLSSMVAKDSHNSSNPPSQDSLSSKAKRTQSLRKKSGRKSGGQKGHKGHTLDFSAFPDELIDLETSFCRSCGSDLSAVPSEFHSKRQVFDISAPQIICIEYRVFQKFCPVCGRMNLADYPNQVNAPVQYGERVHSLIPYFSNYQYVPYHRLSKLFSDVFGLSLSEGTLSNSLLKMGKASALLCEEIQSELSESKVVGSDETGVNVNGKNHWIWVWQDSQNTLLKASDNRGSKTIQDTWAQGLPKSILVTDRWAAQMKTSSRHKQICLAHLQRDIQYLIETEKQDFASECKEWLSDVWKAKKESLAKGVAWNKTAPRALDLEHKLNQLLVYHIDKEKYKQSHIFQKSMLKYRSYLLTTLYHLEVPPDNNASERAIRNVKVKQKVSGFFKSGQEDFCHIRSAIDTAIKRGKDILDTLSNIYKYAT